ncbi:MAG: 50S ribosomal protein L24 [Patescibacteria group bacterium]
MTQPKLKIKKGDLVRAISGKDKGKQGKVIRVIPSKRKAIVEGLFLVKKIRRPKKAGEKGEIIDLPQPVDLAKLMLVCSSCSKPVRIGYVVEGKNKSRICKKCQAKI